MERNHGSTFKPLTQQEFPDVRDIQEVNNRPQDGRISFIGRLASSKRLRRYSCHYLFYAKTNFYKKNARFN